MRCRSGGGLVSTTTTTPTEDGCAGGCAERDAEPVANGIERSGWAPPLLLESRDAAYLFFLQIVGLQQNVSRAGACLEKKKLAQPSLLELWGLVTTELCRTPWGEVEERGEKKLLVCVCVAGEEEEEELRGFAHRHPRQNHTPPLLQGVSHCRRKVNAPGGGAAASLSKPKSRNKA